MKSVGQTIFAFFEDYLKAQKGLRPGSVRSYRDTLKLFLAYVASSRSRPITRLVLPDLSAQRVLDFLNMMEVTRGNRVSKQLAGLLDRLAWAENFLDCRGWTALVASDRLVLGPVFARLARDAKCVAEAAGDLALEMTRP